MMSDEQIKNIEKQVEGLADDVAKLMIELSDDMKLNPIILSKQFNEIVISHINQLK